MKRYYAHQIGGESKKRFGCGLSLVLIMAVSLGCGRQPADDDRATPSGQSPEPPFEPQTQVRQPFPPIENAPFFSKTDADERLDPEDLVLGVAIGGEARAYAVAALESPTREIINDELAGVALAATW